MTDSGILFINNGFRVAIIKRGYKWAYVMFLDGSRIKSKRVKSSKLCEPKPLLGNVPYSTVQLAVQFLTRKTLNGTPYQKSKSVRNRLLGIATRR